MLRKALSKLLQFFPKFGIRTLSLAFHWLEAKHF